MEVVEPEHPVASLTQAELDARVLKGDLVPTPRVEYSTLSVEHRTDSFAEVDQCYSEAEAKAEAARCLDCGICSECLACEDACEIGAIDMSGIAKTHDVQVGAVIMAPGYKPYNAEHSEEFGLGQGLNDCSAVHCDEASRPARGPQDSKQQKTGLTFPDMSAHLRDVIIASGMSQTKARERTMRRPVLEIL